MQLVINYQSVYRFDVSFLYVDEYIYFWILCIFPAIGPSTVQMAIWGIVIAVLEIANANKRSKFYLLISFCFVFFRCLVQFILVEQGEKNGKHALFAPVDLSQQKKFPDWNNSCRMNRQKYGTFFFLYIETLFLCTFSISMPFRRTFPATVRRQRRIFQCNGKKIHSIYMKGKETKLDECNLYLWLTNQSTAKQDEYSHFHCANKFKLIPLVSNIFKV